MIILQGKYNTAKVFTNVLDPETKSQIETLLNQPFVQGSQIRIMPDTHAGAGSTIGTTMTIHDKVVPYMVGVDIGCGMETLVLKDEYIELTKFDKAVHTLVPAGFAVQGKPHPMAQETEIDRLLCKQKVNISRAHASIGTLGGGNHFIELARGEDGKLYLIIHSGSRSLGLQVANFYQDQAVAYQQKNSDEGKKLLEQGIKGERKDKEIQKKIKKIALPKGMSKSLAWLEGEGMEAYLHDMAITQHYANVNRKAIAHTLVKHMGLKVERAFTTIHNYIDLENHVLRKGAVSAQKEEEVLIPINMRDGSLLCIGKGNKDWNYSAPHGAGRIMSRRAAKATITLKAYQKAMEGIFSTTVNHDTLDEAPYAYKPIDEILQHIGDTVEVIQKLTPIYSFKAAGD